MGKRDFLFLAVVIAGVLMAGAGISRSGWSLKTPTAEVSRGVSFIASDLQPIIQKVDQTLQEGWSEAHVQPVAQASDLAIMRRTSLALTGSIPSLEEIRRFEMRPVGERIGVHRENLIKDRRFADYLAERLARAFVGVEDGPFVVFRRRRFVAWLSDALLANRPYNAIVRDMIAEQGLWTDHPATNFVSVTFDQERERPDPERLAARVSRAFLGSRIDCAQCHDHPFQAWKQDDFRGLAAYFGGVHSNLRGITDGELDYAPTDRKTKVAKPVVPRVPSLPELCPSNGSPREQLATWVTDPRNPGLARATVNRIWALMYGRPLVEPIDDLPPDDKLPPILLLLADDFATHQYDLHRLIRILTEIQCFRLESAQNDDSTEDSLDSDESWAWFPLTRLRPEQVAGALYQSSSVTTLGPESPWLMRLISYTQRNDFVRRYGDNGEDEFNARAGTIPQRLLLMNGELVGERIKADLFTSSSQIATMSPDSRKAVESAFLAVLTRRPTPEESAHFTKKLEGATEVERKDRLTDLCWTLLNSTEFSWNH